MIRLAGMSYNGSAFRVAPPTLASGTSAGSGADGGFGSASTLTEADATLSGLTKPELAIQWQAVLQSALGRAIQAAEPEYFHDQLRKLPYVLLGGAVVTFLLILFRRRLRKPQGIRHHVGRFLHFRALVMMR